MYGVEDTQTETMLCQIELRQKGGQYFSCLLEMRLSQSLGRFRSQRTMGEAKGGWEN